MRGGSVHGEDNGSVLCLMLHGLESAVRVGQGEPCDTWLNLEILSELQEIASIVSRHIGNTTNLTFSPEKFVVIKCLHLIEVNRIDGDNSAFS